jgi:hypothetical protein
MSELPAIKWVLTNKELIAFVLSIAAFVISFVSFVQKSAEKRMGIRKQLTDTIAKLLDLNAELSKANDPNTKDKYPSNYGHLVGDQRRLIVRQAKYLADQIMSDVSPYEEMVIGIGFDDIDDPIQAETMMRSARDRMSGEFETVIVNRQYARFLFRQGRVSEGREHFETAAAMLKGTTERYNLYNGDTYDRWARAEMDLGDILKVGGLLDRAEKEFDKIRSPGTRQRFFARLNDFRNDLAKQKRDVGERLAEEPR